MTCNSKLHNDLYRIRFSHVVWLKIKCSPHNLSNTSGPILLFKSFLIYNIFVRASGPSRHQKYVVINFIVYEPQTACNLYLLMIQGSSGVHLFTKAHWFRITGIFSSFRFSKILYCS